MTIHISGTYGDGIAAFDFYPKKNPVKVATGPAGALGGGGWSVDTWANVVQISIAKSDGTWEDMGVLPLAGNIPSTLDVSTRAVDHSYVGTWTNTTGSYSIDVDAYKKVSGVWTADWNENRAAGSTASTRHFYTGGEQVRFRARYNNGGVLGDWSDYATGIIPA